MLKYYVLMIDYLVLIILFVVVLECVSFLITKTIRSKFQWFIIPNDQKPVLSKKALNKFFMRAYDSELGWIKKPNTKDFVFDKNRKT